MLGHLGVNVTDLAEAKTYYDRVMPLLGYEPYLSDGLQFAYRPADRQRGPALFFYPALEDGQVSRHRPGLQHLAFVLDTRQRVHAVHDAVRQLGGEVVHGPQPFPQYRPHYYATFWLDPEGIMLEALCLRPE
ncbi:MAG: VOC family protein [Candidatus Tectomicrobia bacterium]|nr:VOC family protein [Candidatus Tectomicrobia bacterium]